MARVLIGYSCCPLTRQAFQKQGHEVWTCDLLPARDNSPWHIQGDVWGALSAKGWDMAVLHPMCTYLTVSAAWAYGDGPYHQKVKQGTLVGHERRLARSEAIINFRALLALPFPVAIENPAISFVNKAISRPTQVIQPYQFGDDASKATGLWLSGLPALVLGKRLPGRIVQHNGKMVERWANQTDSGQNRLAPSANRWLERSKTYPGIAAAMGDQWGDWLNNKNR